MGQNIREEDLDPTITFMLRRGKNDMVTAVDNPHTPEQKVVTYVRFPDCNSGMIRKFPGSYSPLVDYALTGEVHGKQ